MPSHPYFLFIVEDLSPVVIDEKNGIIYSPGLKRVEYMTQRLKEMKAQHENLSPTGEKNCNNVSC